MPFQNSDNCIFCLDSSTSAQPLIYNTGCQCKYTFHSACFKRYNKTECPLCKRTMIQDLHISVAVSSKPVSGKVVRSVPQTSSRSGTNVPLLSSSASPLTSTSNPVIYQPSATSTGTAESLQLRQKKLLQMLCTLAICGLILFALLYTVIWLNSGNDNN